MPVHLDTDAPSFALADLPTSTIEAMTGAALGQPFTLDSCVMETIGYLWGSPATAGLWKVRITGTASGAPASFQYFVKLVRHLRLWPMLHTIAGADPGRKHLAPSCTTPDDTATTTPRSGGSSST